MKKIHLRLGVCLIALGATAGCATYQSEKADLIRGGGQSARLQAAQERRATAEAEQQSLLEDKMSATEELAALQAELRAVNRNRAVQEGRLQQARSDSRISSEEAARLKRQLNSQTDALNDKVLELEAARSGGSSNAVARKRNELDKLRADLATTNREIEILSQ